LRGVLNIGVLPTIAPYLLPQAVTKFTKRFPGLELVLHEDTTANLLKLTLGYEIDFALTSDFVHDPRLEARELFSEELLLATPQGHRLLKKGAISIEDLEKERLIVMQEGHCLGDQVMSFCGQGSFKANVSFRSAQLETVQSLVRAGMGISLVPAMATKSGRADMPVYRSFSPPHPTRKIIATWPIQRPPHRAANEFLKLLIR